MTYFWPDWPWDEDLSFSLLHNKVLLVVADPPGLSAGIPVEGAPHIREGKIALVKDSLDHWAIPDRGEVIQIGVGVPAGVLEELDVGDWVIYNKQTGDDYQRGDDHLLIISPDEILLNVGEDGPRW